MHYAPLALVLVFIASHLWQSPDEIEAMHQRYRIERSQKVGELYAEMMTRGYAQVESVPWRHFPDLGNFSVRVVVDPSPLTPNRQIHFSWNGHGTMMASLYDDPSSLPPAELNQGEDGHAVIFCLNATSHADVAKIWRFDPAQASSWKQWRSCEADCRELLENAPGTRCCIGDSPVWQCGLL